MSNIVLHSTHATPALKNDTNFVNLFLDNLIENYCNKRYTENKKRDRFMRSLFLNMNMCIK